LSRATALVVDDSPDIRTILSYLLSDLGFNIVEAADGHEAVRTARQCQPALIFLDLCIPGLDGWEVVERLRSDPALEEVPIIIMTAYYVGSTEQLARRAGCQRVIPKPFDLFDLTRLVHVLMSPANGLMPLYA
jgi:CheY-like chemotaxis protein